VRKSMHLLLLRKPVAPTQSVPTRSPIGGCGILLPMSNETPFAMMPLIETQRSFEACFELLSRSLKHWSS
jgi:hypothetical protein